MATSKLLTLQVSDIVNWFRAKELVINESFQRHSVWTAAAKTYLIDTILNELPVPKIYLRSKIDRKTQKAIREVVDGQQRVRALVEFADDRLRLTSRSEHYAGATYSTLPEEAQSRFLGYTLGVDQLFNATDDDVIDVFARLNSYTVQLNAAEKRHARFQTEFKWAVRRAAQQWASFWEKYEVFTVKRRFRMDDDTLMAEIFGVFLEGVRDGGATKIDALYKRQDDDEFTTATHAQIRKRIDASLRFLDSELGDAIKGEFSKPYHLLMLVACYAYNRFGIPNGQVDPMPKRGSMEPSVKMLDGLAKLENALSSDSPPKNLIPFVKACEASTHRIASRQVRFRAMHWVLTQQSQT